MSSVDNRIVNMGFNGQQFFQGVLQSISLLSQLEQSLQLKNATTGIDRLGNAANRLDLGGISSDVNTLASRFSTLGVVGMSVINNLTSRAISAGGQLVKALTLDPIFGGYNEFELKMKSVQTILANTQSRFGTTNADVTKALDELNDYADKTIYNFAEMTTNIGRFTTAGIDLDTSVKGIKGLANLGAFFNADASQVNRAMYQMSQAMAAGSVKLMDWNSLVNANMGGSEFVDDLKRVARRHGIAIDQMIADEGSFRETLRKGWLTNDIFLESLGHFAEVQSTDVLQSQGYSEEEIKKIQYLGTTANEAATKVRSLSQLWSTLNEEAGSGWERTWELIFGDFEQSTELFDGAYKMLNPLIKGMGDARNALFEGWNDLGGRNLLIDAVTQLGQKGLDALGLVGDSFFSVFDISPQGLYDVTKALADFVSQLHISEQAAQDAKSTFSGVFSFFDIIGKTVGFGARAVGELVGALWPLHEGVLHLTGALGGGVTGFDKWLDESQIFSRGIENLHESLGPLRELTTNASQGLSEFVDYAVEKLQILAPIVMETFEGIGDSMRAAIDTLDDTTKPIQERFGDAFDAMKKAAEEKFPQVKDQVDKFFDDLQTEYQSKGLENATEQIKDELGAAGANLTEGGESINVSVEQFGEQTQGNASVLSTVGGYLGQFVEAFKALPWTDLFAAVGVFGAGWTFKNLSSAFYAAGHAFKGVQAVIDETAGLIGNLKSAAGYTGTAIKLHGYSEIITSIGILIGAMAGLSAIEGWKPGSTEAALSSLNNVLWTIAGIVGTLGLIANVMPGGGMQNLAIMEGVADTITTLAIAMAAISGSIALMKDMTPDQIMTATNAMMGLMTLMSVLAEFLQIQFEFSSKAGKMLDGKKSSFFINNKATDFQNLIRSMGLIGSLVTALMGLSNIVSNLGGMVPSQLERGLNAVQTLMLDLAGVITVASLMTSRIKGSRFSMQGGQATFRFIALVAAIALSLKPMADAVSQLGNMYKTSLNQGLGAMTMMLTGLALFMTAMVNLVNSMGSVDAGFLDTGFLKAISAAILLTSATGAFVGLAQSAQILGSMDPMGLVQAGLALLAIGGMVGGMVYVMNKLVSTSLNKSMILRAATTAILMGAAVSAILGLAEAAKAIGGAGAETDWGGIVSVAGLLISLGLAIKLMSSSLKNVSWMNLAILGTSIGSLVAALAVLAQLDLGGILTGLVGMGVALVVIAGAAAVLGPLSGALIDAGLGLAIFSSGLLITAAAASLFANAISVIAQLAGPALQNLAELLPTIVNGLIDAIVLLGNRAGELGQAVGGVFVGLVDSFVRNLGDFAGTIGQLLIDLFNSLAKYVPDLIDAIVKVLCLVFEGIARNAGVIMTSIADMVGELNKAFNDAFGEITVDPGSVDELLKAMWETFALITLMKLTKTTIGDALKCALELGLVFGAMAGIFAIIGSVADADSVAAVDQLNDAMATIAIVCGIFSVIPWQTSLAAVGSFDAFVGGLAASLAALGGIKQIPGVDWLVQEGGDFLQHIGEAIGKFLGGIGAGITSAATSNFGEIGSNLAAFATNAEPFLNVIQNYDETTVSNINAFKDMVNAIGALGSDGMKGIEKVKEVSKYMPDLATGMKDFSDKMAGADPKVMDSAAGLITSLGTIAQTLQPMVVDQHGTEAKMTTLTDFSSQLGTFADDLKGAVDKFPPADQLDTSGLEKVIDVANSLVTLQSNLPQINEGSDAWFSGSTMSINSFATGITAWSDAMQDALTRFPSDQLTDTSGIDEMIQMTQALADIQSQLAESTKIQGWGAQQFMGIGELGNQIRILGENLDGADLSFKSFGEEGEFSPARMRNMLALVDGLADVQTKLSSVKFNGGDANKVVNIGGLARTIAEHITDFSTLATGITSMQVDDEVTTKFTNFGKCLEALAGVQNKLAEFSGDDKTISGQTISLGTFINKLAGEGSTFMTDMGNLITGVGDFDPSKITTLNDICTNMGTLATTINGFTPVDESLITMFASNISSFCRMFSDPKGGFALLGGNDFTAISTNIQTLAGVIPQLISAFDGLAGTGDGTTDITGFLQGLKDLFAIDFATGVTDMTAGIQTLSDSISTELGEVKATFEAKAAEFETAGKQLGAAFVNGINNFGGGASPDVSTVVTACLNAISDKLSDFRTKGEEAGGKFVEGVASQEDAAYNAGVSLASQAAAGASGGYDQMFTQGANAGQGYVNGLKSKIAEAEAAASRLAAIGAEGTANEQQSKSPSKVFRRLGAYAGEGYALGIEDTFGLVNRDAGEMVGHALSLAQQLSSTLGENGDPVIRPIYDGSDVDKGIAGTDAMLRALQNRALATGFGLAHGVSDTIAQSESKEAESKDEPLEANPTYNFTQNNYSPKAISRLEVYRDTKGLLALAKKGAVK